MPKEDERTPGLVRTIELALSDGEYIGRHGSSMTAAEVIDLRGKCRSLRIAEACNSVSSLREALKELEAHHVEQNRMKRRDESESKTLAIIRAALSGVTQPASECPSHPATRSDGTGPELVAADQHTVANTPARSQPAKQNMRLTAQKWAEMSKVANAEIVAMISSERMRRMAESDMLFDGGKIATSELARVNAFCDALLKTIAVDGDEATWTGETQSLVQILLRQPATEVEKISTAANDVLAERERQKAVEGWTPEHDDTHANFEMARAAAFYALHTAADILPEPRPEAPSNRYGLFLTADQAWPPQWDHVIWKKPKGARRNLVRAAALLIAEIERIDRAEVEKISTDTEVR